MKMHLARLALADPAFREKFGPRGVLHCWANPDGSQRIEDTGPLTKKRMETCDEEFRDAAVDFIKAQDEAQTPFFVWFNSTHMHFRTHPKPESIGRAGRVNGQCELRTGGQESSGSADTKSPGLRTVSASPPGADSVNAGQAAPVRAAVTATVVYRIVKLPPTASMAAPPRCPSSPRPPTPNATPSNYSAPPSH
jgi:hypothetical protein